ncbi:MAG: hypothetical protein B6247_26785 [Candidatus Parabeggiatoa sp. nov. 2]|nr:MAG: hypothetical protein B6247_26785 [Beggiatoa sp. 4572_84]
MLLSFLPSPDIVFQERGRCSVVQTNVWQESKRQESKLTFDRSPIYAKIFRYTQDGNKFSGKSTAKRNFLRNQNNERGVAPTSPNGAILIQPGAPPLALIILPTKVWTPVWTTAKLDSGHQTVTKIRLNIYTNF